MDKSKNIIPLLGIAFAAGGFVIWFLITILGAKPKTVSVGPVEFEVPNEQTITTTSVIMNTPVSVATPIPTTRPPTSLPYAVHWVQEVSQVPESGNQLTWSLSAGQVMLLSGGQLQVGETFCGGDVQQICVLVYKASADQIVTVNNLVPRLNYVGIAEALSPNEALKEKESLFWMPPNCTNGCRKATVLFFEDGVLVDKVFITAP